MAKKPEKPESVPVEILFREKGFKRNYALLMRGPGDEQIRQMVTDELIANAVANVESKESQRARSSLPRPKKNDDGDTLDSLIAKLARRYPGEGPGALWVPFKAALEEWSGDEVHEVGDGKSRMYWYWLGEEQKSIAIETFRKKVSALRKGDRTARL